MNLSSTIRPSLSKLTFVFIGLAISVFTWGLQYKLSLYYPPHSAHHQIPEAKLLSRNEQAAVTEGALLESPKAQSAIVCAGLFGLMFFVWVLRPMPVPAPAGTERERKRPWVEPLRTGLSAFSFRPPPASA